MRVISVQNTFKEIAHAGNAPLPGELPVQNAGLSSAHRWQNADTAIPTSRSYPGTPAQVGEARAFLGRLLYGCPAADDAVLLCSELCANAVQYSNSRAPGGQFSVHVRVSEGGYVWAGVQDQGGPWEQRPRDAERRHGLDIVRMLAGDGCWGIFGDRGGRLAWYRLGWAGAGDTGPAPVPLAS